MSLSVWLRLGRVSNLPTVWSNVIAALALSGALGSGGANSVTIVLELAAVFSAFYVAGMFLNDAFDREIDRRERPTRPIPSGQVSAARVFAAGFGLLGAATLATVLIARGTGAAPLRALGSALTLALLIVGYDLYHKQNPFSPVLMGACRVMVYVTALFVVHNEPPALLLTGALVLWCYLIGLTYAAKQEAFNRLTRVWPLVFLAVPVVMGVRAGLDEPWVWPFLIVFVAWLLHALRFLRPGPERAVPEAVVRLIAGIALADALHVAATGQFGWALVCVALCAATRVFQRVIPGT